MSSKVTAYEIVTERIVAALESGVAPWRKPWRTTAPISMSSGKPYRGVNVFLLMGDGSNGSNWWGTYKKVTELGGQIRKGEKATTAVYWKMLDREDANGDAVRIPMLRYFNVFSATQADWEGGMPERFSTYSTPNDPIAAADGIVEAWKASGDAPRFSPEPSDRAAYAPKADKIMMPHRDAFETSDLFYSTLFHECTHATGAAKRLNRPGVADFDAFGTHSYGIEELIAEMGAAMLCGQAGIETTIESSAAYLAAWLNTINEDPRMVVTAAQSAQKAVDRILGVTWD